MRFRQIHLDFHTSGLIGGIGSRFDARDFARAFKAAHVDSVTVFSKCHHGLSYHPTKIGRMHPGLDFDLLRAQIDALHAEGIAAPIYLSAAWDEHAAFTHADWRIVTPDGHLPQSRNEPTGWAFLDFASPYLDYLCAQIDEVLELYPDGDGIFIDICSQLPSISPYAKAKMEARGLDWTSTEDRTRFGAEALEIFYRRLTDTVRARAPGKSLFFNSGHIRRGNRDHVRKYYSHLELESLPTAGWGYDHFPISARYVDPLGIPFLGMTGKFHFTWGEIGGYKRPEALVYECAAMLAHGARCSIGDHLHPTGFVDASTMSIIGAAYDWVERRESWVVDSVNRAEIGLLSLEAARHNAADIEAPARQQATDDGATRMLLEAGLTFDVLDLESDFTPYRLLILPDAVPIGADLKGKLETYLANGGRLLMTGRSGIDATTGFVLDVGAVWEGTSPMAGGDYLLPTADWRADGIDEPNFMYGPSERIRVSDGQSMGSIYEPYFDRTPLHFSGHINVPRQPDPSGYDGGSAKGPITYLAHPVFAIYTQVGAVRMLEMIERAIANALGGDRLIKTNLPRAGRVTVRRQPAHNRDVVYLLHATPALRGYLWDSNIQPIQDLVTLRDITVSLEADRPVDAVRLIPAGPALPFTVANGRVSFTAPEVTGVAMIEVAYRSAPAAD
ncbi:beta-galactosidase trimerization domain-containing protein [Pleomorphomonas sp. PLEO]|uniref:beta-galactosidase trimerization domain-containing protein n=1 Tax=Pleomorphomonas sp. PLEO TaxID=3239306 RepID=UPI00351E67CC